ncbi:hypothetical protein DID80_01460 [Candidatus Marinamargulisbacteria bacterium SCGC AAA071-K20]|nr:hypothetical protein DID80_01460 [Candidatus Marinamargulisbacteria bacterium SCGC AAA071-K20]
MNSYALTPLIALIVNLTLWILIYSGIKKTQSSTSYQLYIGFVIGLLFFEFLNLSTINVAYNLIILKYQSIFWLLSPLLFLNFLHTLRNHKMLPYFKIILSLFVPVMIISTQSNLVVAGVKSYYWGNDLIAGPLFLPLLVVTFLIPICMTIVYLLLIIFKKSSSKVATKQSIYILLGTILTVAVISLSDIILPHVLSINKFPRIGASTITIQVLFIFFAIFFYSLLEIKIDRAVGYIFRHSSNSILIINPDSTIRYANHSARKLLSVNNEDIFGTKISNILKNDDEYNIKFNFTNKKVWIGNAKSLKTYLISQITVRDWNIDYGKILLIKTTRRDVV